MKIIKANANILSHEAISPYQFIERVGRICYKSEDMITENSSKQFVIKLINSNHMAMLEHEHVYIQCACNVSDGLIEVLDPDDLKYLNISSNCISGSFRAFFDLFDKYKENSPIVIGAIYSMLTEEYPDIFEKLNIPVTSLYNLEDIQFYLSKMSLISRDELPNIVDNTCVSKHLIHSVLFTCDRGVSHELVRHRVASFAQESTRYCNYSKDKFGKEITVIEPLFFERGSKKYNKWKRICDHCETHYFELLDMGATPQEARSILPNSLKTEIVVTATEEEWQHIINLRYHGTTGKPHPQMKEVMEILYPNLCIESQGRLK